MKITRIGIKSFLGLDALDLTIERPVLLVTGPNAVGKTTIRNALQFVLCDDLCRVSLKKNVKSLLREGAKLGSVTISMVDGGPRKYARSAATGHYIGEDLPTLHPALAYLLDPPAFLALTPNERRDFLFRLMNVSLSPAAVREKLEKRGHDAALLTRIAPQLRQGFTAAHTEAQGLARETKGRWREISGTDYGSVKAEGWAAEAPAGPADGPDPLAGDLAILEKSIGQAQRECGAFQARREEASRLAARLARTRADAEHIEEYTAVEQAVRQQWGRLAAEERNLTDELEAADSRATLAGHIPQGTFLACPECGASLVYDRGDLKPGSPATLDDAAALTQAEQHAAERRQALETLQGRRKTKESELLYATEALGHARSAKETVANLKGIDDPPAESTDAILKRLDALKNQREKLRAGIQAHEQARAQATEAASKTERARRLHEEIKALIALAADLAPDGLPAELLAQALGPINARLMDSAAMTGWPQVTIDTDEMWLSGRPLALASDSERWRAAAVIAEAIAALSGIKLFCLDGGDVLDVKNRSVLMAWLTAIAPEHESIICLATLKSPPANLPQSIQTHWLDGAAA